MAVPGISSGPSSASSTSKSGGELETALRQATAGTRQSVFINVATRGASLEAKPDTGGSLAQETAPAELWHWYLILGLGVMFLLLGYLKRRT